MLVQPVELEPPQPCLPVVLEALHPVEAGGRPGQIVEARHARVIGLVLLDHRFHVGGRRRETPEQAGNQERERERRE